MSTGRDDHATSRRVRGCRLGRRTGLVALLAAATLAAPAPAPAEDPAPPPAVDLDKLMKLPSSHRVDVERRGGATRTEWRSRFRDARGDLETAQAGLKKAQLKLDKAAAESDSAWRMAPPGAAATSESTERYPLTLDLKRKRSEVERSEKRLRELEVEANLAGVPKDWREDPPAEPAAAPSATEHAP
jgi:hypothetical protein